MNIKVNYLYRDYSNYKNFNSVVIANPNNIPLSEIDILFKKNLIDGEFFNAEGVGLPILFFDDITEDDHHWHEFESLETTDEPVTVELKVEEIVKRLKIVSGAAK